MRSLYLFFIILSLHYATSSPIPSDIVGSTTKKDVFISRGWGAGGMPFSVLYMNPLGSRGSTSVGTQPIYQHQHQHQHESRPKALPQVRTAGNGGGMTNRRKQYSIIPQLFVSYGWGPLGK